VVEALKTIQFNEAEHRFFRQQINIMYKSVQTIADTQKRSLQLQLEQAQTRLSKLTDSYLDGTIEQEIYLEKKNAYLMEEKAIKERLAKQEGQQPQVMRQVEQFLELVNNAYTSYKLATPEEKQELVKTTTSNLMVTNKTAIVKLNYPFQVVADRHKMSYGAPSRATARKIDQLLAQLVEYFSQHPISSLGGL